MSSDIAEMHFVRSTEYTLLDHEKNENIMGELQIPQVMDFIKQYKRSAQSSHQDSMDDP